MDRRDAEHGNLGERRAAVDGFAPHIGTILEALRVSPKRAALYWLGAGLVVVIGATAYGQIELNAWNQPFYDALARKDLPAFGCPARRFRDHRRGSAGPERRPDLAQLRRRR